MDGDGRHVACCCAGLVAVVRATAPDVPSVELEFDFAFMFIPQAILPLWWRWSMRRASCSDEQEEQTLTYLLDPADSQVGSL